MKRFVTLMQALSRYSRVVSSGVVLYPQSYWNAEIIAAYRRPAYVFTRHVPTNTEETV